MLMQGAAFGEHVAVILEPFGPSKNVVHLLQCEEERRQEEGWPASNRGDRAISDTESGASIFPLFDSSLLCCEYSHH